MNDRYDELHDERLSALYRETREVEPPAWLDQRILMMAGAALEPRPASMPAVPKRRVTRWAVPLALAATVVLAVGIVRMARETGELGAPAETAALRSLAKPAAEADAAATGRAGSLSADRELPRAAPPVAPPISAPAAGAVPFASQPVPAFPAAPRQRSTISAEEKKQELLRAVPVPEEQEPASVRDPISHRSPAEWLAEIAELRRQGRAVEAEASLAEFRRRYPDYPLDTEASPR